MAKMLAQVEHYLDANPRKPEAYARFRNRLTSLENEYDKWASIVFDDVTWMELAARRYHQYHLNPGDASMKSMKWYGGSTDLLEEDVSQTITSMPVISGVACHVAHEKVQPEAPASFRSGKPQMQLGKDAIEKDEVMGFMVRVPSAPGRLKDRQQLLSAYSEVYHMGLRQDDDGNIVRYLQTQIDYKWIAASRIGAPNPCDPHYECLWEHWQGPRTLTKFLVYGDPGSGKSTFLSTFPKPLLVMSFDPYGKEIPYLKMGHVVDGTDDAGTPMRQVFSVPKPK